MKEITFFGRGGQGAVVASEILAEAYFREGYQVQSFPSFGVERRGAPVTAFLRINKEFIYVRSMIYQADTGLVLSANIIQSPIFLPSMKKGSTILINSETAIENLDDYKISTVDATGIALECGLGSSAQPLVNTAILGAYAKIAGNLELDNLLGAVEKKVPQKTEKNLLAIQKAFASVVCFE
ncbi:MAG: 2-oxoacid:acceptor oxidoreductase family protein [Candidatus Zixiibacteriota bacterium]